MKELWALGAMSGTSLDGVDAAMVRTDGVRIVDFGDSAYRPYTQAERDVLRAGLGRWHGDPGVMEVEKVVERAHTEVLSGFEGAEIIGFHGQTLAHDPKGRGTHQAGSGSRMAHALGCPVVWDFRSADVGLGGEGAPLAPAFHFACAKWIRATAPVVFLNLGGVANITWVDPSRGDVVEPGAVLAFDTGPANAPMDDLVRAATGKGYDADGAIARTGTRQDALIDAVLTHRFFARMPPKSLDRNELARVLDPILTLPLADALATVSGLIAKSVAQAVQVCPAPPARVLVTGGGRHNAHLMAELRRALPCTVAPVEEVGLDGDMLEAQAFAYLAVRVLHGLPTSFPSTTGVAMNVGGGQVARPDARG